MDAKKRKAPEPQVLCDYLGQPARLLILWHSPNGPRLLMPSSLRCALRTLSALIGDQTAEWAGASVWVREVGEWVPA